MTHSGSRLHASLICLVRSTVLRQTLDPESARDLVAELSRSQILIQSYDMYFVLSAIRDVCTDDRK